MNDVKFPIVPMRTYKYDPLLAGYGQQRIGTYESGPNEMWEAEGRIRGANVIYGLVKWKDPRNQWYSADCGLLWWPMYDFCGGAVVSSAFVDVRPGVRGTCSRGASQKELPVVKDPGLIIDLAELTGEENLTPAKVERLLERSLLSGLLTDLIRWGRCGAVVGDRITANNHARTSPILLQAATMAKVPFYSHLRTSYYDSPENPPRLNEVAVRVHSTPSFRNRNSGNMVEFTTIDFDSHDTGRVAGFEGCTLPEQIWKNLTSPEFAALCPQYLFHN